MLQGSVASTAVWSERGEEEGEEKRQKKTGII